MGKKGDLSDFERGMFVGARRTGLSISKTAFENALLMSEVRGEWADWLDMIEREQ